MKQRIVLPNKVTATVFDLPCVHSVSKSGGGVVYYIVNEGFAKPGDALVEDDNGRWRIERKKI